MTVSGLTITREWRQLGHRQDRMTQKTLSVIPAPSPCINHVITHELCHFVHRDHGPAFERVMPDWERRKAGLECTLI